MAKAAERPPTPPPTITTCIYGATREREDSRRASETLEWAERRSSQKPAFNPNYHSVYSSHTMRRPRETPDDQGPPVRAKRQTTRRGAPTAAPLNREQQAFVDAPLDSSLVLLAAAGSGKTKTLVDRIAALLAGGRSVRVFSHANKTVDELKERLRTRADTVAAVANVSTMHKYCAHRLCQRGLRVPRSCDALIEAAAELFECGTLSCEESHVIVDEAQDLSTEQNAIVLAMLAQGAYVAMAGDAMQSIYGFQGSSPAHLKRFAEQLRSDCRFSLLTNYRATNSRLVELSNAIAVDDIAAGLAVHTSCCPGALPGLKPQLLAYRTEDDLHAAILEVLGRLHGDGSSVAVLGHENAKVGRVHNYLVAHRKPAVLHSSKRSGEFKRVPTRLQRAGVVQCLTIHGDKGGEQDHIILVTGDDRGNGVEVDQGDEGSESRRCLYTACTRARKTLTIFYRNSQPRDQPCRWLSNAWDLLAPAESVRRFVSGGSYERLAPETLSVTDLMAGNAVAGFHRFFDDGDAPSDRPDDHYSNRILQLAQEGDAEDGASSPAENCIDAQAHRAYDLGLEMFVGRLFELHAQAVFDGESVRARARQVLRLASQAFVRKEMLDYLRSEEGRVWWADNADAYLEALDFGMTAQAEALAAGESEGRDSDEDAIFSARILTTCSPKKRELLNGALRPSSVLFKFKGYAPAQIHFHEALLVARNEASKRGTPPPFESLFRGIRRYWDDYDVKLRPSHCRAFEAALRVADGSLSSRDLCYFAALDVFWSSGDGGNGEACKPLLHLALPPSNPVSISIEEMRLDEKAVAQIEEDAHRIRTLLGEALALEVQNVVTFACLADYGDRALSAEGAVRGRCDVLFEAGPLEIKAVKHRLEDRHCAQAIWYASSGCALGCSAAPPRPHGSAFLWDLYRRRLLVWENLEGQEEFLRKCLLQHLRCASPPGGCRRIWPQRVRIDAAQVISASPLTSRSR